MEIDLFRIFISILLIFFLPGFFLVQALFPRRNELEEEDDWLYRVALAIALSIVITTLDGFILGSLGVNQATGKGYWDTPYIFSTLIGFSVILFVIGWYRGAYPLLGRKPKEETPIKIPKEDKAQFYKIMSQWKKLQKELERLDDQFQDENIDIEEYQQKSSEIKKELEAMEKTMVNLGEKEIPIIIAKKGKKTKRKKNI